jgi:hypothetical protein
VISALSLFHPLVNSPLGYHVTQLILASQPPVSRKPRFFEYQSLLDELGERVTWVTHLRLDFSGWRWEDCSVLLDFTPSRQLRQLESIEAIESRQSAKQLAIIKQLSSLRSFRRVRYDSASKPLAWAVQELQVLFSPPHQLQRFTNLCMGVDDYLTAAHMESLVLMPQLERLDPLGLSTACRICIGSLD